MLTANIYVPNSTLDFDSKFDSSIAKVSRKIEVLTMSVCFFVINVLNSQGTQQIQISNFKQIFFF